MLNTNRERLVKVSTIGEVVSPTVGTSIYRVSANGEPMILPGVGGITYNVRVGTTPTGVEIMSPMSLADGTRKIVRRGNVGHNTEWVINLPAVVRS